MGPEAERGSADAGGQTCTLCLVNLGNLPGDCQKYKAQKGGRRGREFDARDCRDKRLSQKSIVRGACQGKCVMVY
jgi:hypothetical protein